ncbi:MAG: tRNA dihydrouridine synthase DusB [Oscillospiraceae bacterium]
MEYINIGNVKIKKTAALAPMASIADRAYRLMCKKYNVAYLVSEMVSSKGIYYGDKKTHELLTIDKGEYPYAIQLFGEDPLFMAKATQKALEYNPSIIDINMGCPVPKIVGNGCGSALMKNPKLSYEIVKAVKSVSTVPVTVKFRKGFESDTAATFAKVIEQAGADAIAVHGRTARQMYKPPIDLDTIKNVKQAVSIPVIGNGGIKTPQDAKYMYDYTGCDLVMVGQGSYGRPWIFEEIEYFLETGNIMPEKSIDEILEIMKTHIELLVLFKGEKMGMREARTQCAFYFKGVKNAASFRHFCGSLETLNDMYRLIDLIKESQC